MKKILVIIGMLGFGILIAWKSTIGTGTTSGSSSALGDVTITLTPDGFKPDPVTIKQGMSVTFRTTRDTFFWPASDIHPLHNIYPQFDPKEPIASGSAWTFRFTKVGNWKYHDHIAPYYTGTIRVEGNGEREESTGSWKDKVGAWWQRVVAQGWSRVSQIRHACDTQKGTPNGYEDCWKQALERELRTQGLAGTFDLLKKGSEEDIVLAQDCHPYAHYIGELVYGQLQKGVPVDIIPETALCNFGFYHGFMQEYVSHGKDFSGASKFCEDAQKKAQQFDASSNLGTQCFHGIGHGFAYAFGVVHWEDELGTIAESIAGCKQIIADQTSKEFGECVNGVYGGIGAFYFTLHGYRLKMRDTDPFWLCRAQPDPYQHWCYDSMVPPLFMMTGYDMSRAGEFIRAIPDPDTAAVAMEHLGTMPSHRGLFTTRAYMDTVSACRAFGSLAGRCLAGMAKSFILVLSPKEAQKQLTALFALPAITASERVIMAQAVAAQIKENGNTAEQTMICSVLSDIAPLCGKP